MKRLLYFLFVVGLFLSTFTFSSSTVFSKSSLTYSSSSVGYAGNLSNYNDEMDTVTFHISSLSEEPVTTTMFIYKIGEDKQIPVDGQNGIVIPARDLQKLECKQSELGCDWPTVYTLDVSGWESGLYYAYLVDGDLANPPDHIFERTNLNFIIFTIKSVNPTNKILVQLSTNTWQAWNGWNGGAFYYSNPNTTVISFQRPFKNSMSPKQNEAYVFLKWLYDHGYAYDVAVDLDIEEPTFVSRYKLIIPLGHGEYWTPQMYDSLAQFRDNGGNILFLTSNTLYWRNRHTPATHTLESYKIAWLSEDPCYDPDAPDYDPELVTSYFSPALLPYNQDAIDWNHNDIELLGIHGDYTPGVGGYTFYRTQDDDVSWIFAGTGLTDGQRIGEMIGEAEGVNMDEPQIGAAGSAEVDRVRVVFENGLPYPDRTDWRKLDRCDVDNPDFDEDYCVKYAPAPDAPANLKIIGLGDASNRNQDPRARIPLQGATMAIYKTDDACGWGDCSTVVHVGSWNWGAKALNPQISHYDNRFAIITKNLIDKMSAGPAISSSPVQRYKTVTFQQGVEGYIGFMDSTISYSAVDPDVENLQIRGLGAQYSLIKADISSLPEDAEIVSAALLLYGAVAGYEDNTMLIDARRVLSAWDETTSDMPSAQFEEISTARIKIHLSREGEGARDWGKDKWHSFNITPFVKKWHDKPSSNHGVLVFNPLNNLRYVFRSSDYPIVRYRPILAITYSDSPSSHFVQTDIYLPMLFKD